LKAVPWRALSSKNARRQWMVTGWWWLEHCFSMG
jgi:hypothetical protein